MEEAKVKLGEYDGGRCILPGETSLLGWTGAVTGEGQKYRVGIIFRNSHEEKPEVAAHLALIENANTKRIPEFLLTRKERLVGGGEEEQRVLRTALRFQA